MEDSVEECIRQFISAPGTLGSRRAEEVRDVALFEFDDFEGSNFRRIQQRNQVFDDKAC